MTDDDRLRRIDLRQEAVIQAVGALTGVMEDNHAILVEVQAWMQQPPSDELATLLAALIGRLEALQEMILAQGKQLESLPEQIILALKGR